MGTCLACITAALLRASERRLTKRAGARARVPPKTAPLRGRRASYVDGGKEDGTWRR